MAAIYTFKGALTTLLSFYISLRVHAATTPSTSTIKTNESCFKTVAHSYSNPKVTGESVLQFTYKNDDFKTENLTLSCEEEDLYIEIQSVSLSLPASNDDDNYCVESKNSDFSTCTSQKQCDCCERPTETCVDSVVKEPDITQYTRYCNRQKNCTLSVTSKTLNDCPGRKYECESKKCHSRWVDVAYTCQIIDAIPTIPPTVPPTKQGGVDWWKIVIPIIVVLLILIIVMYICWRKNKRDRELDFPDQECQSEEKLELKTDNPDFEEYAVVDKTKKTKKTGNCDAAAIPPVNQQQQQRRSEIQMEENEEYVGFNRNSGISQKDNNTTETDGLPTKPKPKTSKAAPPPPPPTATKPVIGALKAANKPKVQQAKQPEPAARRQAPTKPVTAPPQAPGTTTKPAPLLQGAAAPPKPPRLSDTDSASRTGSPPASGEENEYAKTYGHFPVEGRQRQPRV